MQRCETNKNANLLLKIKLIGRTFNLLDFNYILLHNVSQSRDKIVYGNSSSANFNLQILTFILKFLYLIICIIFAIFLFNKIWHYTTNFQATFTVIVCFTYKFNSTYTENKIYRAKHVENLFEINNWAGCFKG
jgi:uncharacterized membrane protein